MNKKILKKALCLILVMSSITTWAQDSNICGYYYDLRNMNYAIHVSQVITAARQPESMWKLNSVM